MPSSVPVPAAPQIVVVEDDADLLHSLSFAFELEGWPVRTYSSAEALLADGALPARGCLVIDHILPGKSGLELLSGLRASGTTLPAIIVTTHPPAQLRISAAAQGARIVEKPLLNGVLIEAIHEELARGAQPLKR